MRRMSTGAILWLGASASVAQAAAPCIPAPEAKALVLTMLPGTLEAVAARCIATLPATATLRGGLTPLVARYRGEAAGTTALASAGAQKLMGEDYAVDVQPATLLAMFTDIIAKEIAKDVKPRDCARVDEVIGLIAPLPAANVASLVVVLLGSGMGGGKGGMRDLTICPAVKP